MRMECLGFLLVAGIASGQGTTDTSEKVLQALVALRSKTDLSEREEIVRSLVADIGSATGTELVSVVTDASSNWHREAAFALSQVDETAAADNVSKLLEALRGAGTQRRISLCIAIGCGGKRSGLAVPSLTRFLASDNPDLVLAACEALGAIGKPAASSEPAISLLLIHPQPTVRSAAARSLGKVKANSAAAIERLVKALDDKVAFVGRHAALALAKLGPAGLKALAAETRNPRRRNLAVLGLGSAGRRARPWVQHLLRLDPRITEDRLLLLDSLVEIGPPVRSLTPLIVPIFELGSDSDIVLAAGIVAKLGQKAGPILPALMTAYKATPGSAARLGIVNSVGEMGNLEEAVKLLVLALDSDVEQEVRTAAAVSLGRLTAPVPSKALQALTRASGDHSAKVRAAALTSLRRLRAGKSRAAD